MQPIIRLAGILATVICFCGFGAYGALAADPIADFYHGKSIKLVVGSAPGGGYDVYARIVGEYLGANIPGKPSVIIENMPGSGSQKMTNWVYNIAARDGTVIGGPQNGAAFEPLFHLLSPGGKTAHFDATKFNWIGSATQDTAGVFVWSDSGFKTLADMQSKEVIFGSSGANTDNSVMAQVLNSVYHTKIKVTVGYKGTGDMMLAVERGEVQGAAGMPYSSLIAQWPDWISQHKIRFILQLGFEPHPQMTGVPFALDLVKSKDDKAALELIFAKWKMARPYFLPPGVTATKVAAMRKAFMDMMNDSDFVATAKKRRIEINPVRGEEIQALMERLYQTPEPILKRVRLIIGAKD
jgi:tripartite-type tricarboxylate transporter receptor subunit TctC